MKKIIIEWLHYDKEGTTCTRCGNSGATLRKAVEDLKFALKPAKIDIELKEILLSEEQIALSNTIRINGRDIKEILDESCSGQTPCPSCSDLRGQETCCNTFTFQGETYESVPEQMLIDAVTAVAFAEAPIHTNRLPNGACSCRSAIRLK
ncbi:MAG: DUF2703 domain-containing protein [Nitrospirota bacterium]